MKPASVATIKKELNSLDRQELINYCLRLAKYKKDNKELLSYLLFEQDEADYIASLQYEMGEMFETINHRNLYWTKKTLRKILRYLDRFNKYSGKPTTEIELRLFYLQKIKYFQIPISRSKVLSNLVDRQKIKIRTALSKLHEDLQYDYEKELLKV